MALYRKMYFHRKYNQQQRAKLAGLCATFSAYPAAQLCSTQTASSAFLMSAHGLQTPRGGLPNW